MRYLLAVEGPAGSGKSTFIKSLIQSDPKLFALVKHPMEWQRPRAYLGDDGVALSQAKDYLSILGFLASQSPVTIVDRWLISQQVYGAIRQGKSEVPVSVANLELYLRQASLNIHEASTELAWRRGDFGIFGGFVTFQVVFCFILPDEALLYHNRATAGRPFPYSPYQEIPLYQQMAQLIAMTSFRSISLLPRSLEDLNKAPRFVLDYFSKEISHDSLGF